MREDAPREGPPPFPVVALGSSAGGLDPLRHLLAGVPVTSGMAFVVIQHLDPERPSLLASVLEGGTRIPVVEATSGMPLVPDRVHVIPSGADLTVRGGILTLVPRQSTGRLHLPIDAFFRALAADAKDRAVGVVLSGSGADGTDGLRAIKADGGITIAQEPTTAQYPSMPEGAIEAGLVDFSGSPEAIAAELTRLSRHPYVTADRTEDDVAKLDPTQETGLVLVLNALRRGDGVDFSGYKRTTVLRRIERRMALRHVESIDEYARLLDEDTTEGRALGRDMLIHVTAFFRDPTAFDALQERVFEPLVERMAPDETVRIWVPGCASGEEVYALAICLWETMDGKQRTPAIQVFGTDLSDDAIDRARAGVYPDTAIAGVSPKRLKRFFDREGSGHRIARHIRDLCVFVKHDLIRDPPFAKLDLISCRNVLIYFDADLQRRVIPMLHYALNPGGALFLGQSETITGFRELFEAIDQDHRIFLKTGDSRTLTYPLGTGRGPEAARIVQRGPERRPSAREAVRQADHLMLTRFAPPGVIVNARFEITQFRGRTGDFLEPAPGQPQGNVLRMARGGLAAHLHEALERAKSESVSVRKEGLQFQLGSQTRSVDMEVIPLAAVGANDDVHYLVVFEPAAADHRVTSTGTPTSERAAPLGTPTTPADDQTRELERIKAELSATKDYLQSLISEHQSTTDELAATNEELIAANEELQSINEELQSAKEELQSTNEELSTVNDQLRHRNVELDEVANDLVNVLASVEIPVIIVDAELRVRRYTPTVRDIARFIPEDLGRPIDDLKLHIEIADLPDRIRSVIDAGAPREWEIRGPNGHWFRMQIRPYRTSQDELDGAVLSFVDVDVLRRAVDDAERSRDYSESIIETISSALVVLDEEVRIVSANTAFYEAFAPSVRAAGGRHLADLSAELWSLPALREALEGALQDKKAFAGLEIVADSGQAARRSFAISGRPILWGGGTSMALLAIDDVTALRKLEVERDQLLASETQARLEAERATRAKDLFLATLSHELRTPLGIIVMSAQLLRHIDTKDPKIAKATAAIERAANTQVKLIDDLLDVSRIISGKLMLELGPVEFESIVREAVDINQPPARLKGVELELAVNGLPTTVFGDETRLLQVVSNLLNNGIKFTPRGGRISVVLDQREYSVELSIADTGMGIEPSVLPRLFSRFVQADGAMTRAHGGLGLGLSIVRHLVEVHGGTISVESPGEGRGSTFRIVLPTAQSDGQTAPLSPRSITRSIEGIRVLLVDDDDDTREAYAAMLVELGTQVRAEPSAARALAEVGQFHPDVILSDIAMPNEDGLSFIKKVRRLPRQGGGRVPAAAVTALASEEDRRTALAAGFQIHVSKPLDATRLAAVVATLVDWSSDHEDFDPN